MRATLILLLLPTILLAQPREDRVINDGWTSALNGGPWQHVDIPHNWDDYGGYRRLRHGNLHGYALYKRTISIAKQPNRRYFLWFEGVGSFATVWVNGQLVGSHAGGRTSFTVDITDALNAGGHPGAGQSSALGQRTDTNIISVRADHPAFIRDLPWVCGGCSDERGFSEGSQPLGIFRPVHLVITPPTRIEPFGVHIWNDTTISQRSATLHLETELKNYDTKPVEGALTQQLLDAHGNIVATIQNPESIAPGQTLTIPQQLTDIAHPHLWSDKDPYLYTLVSTFKNDQVRTPYGIRKIHFADPHAPGPHPFLLNGRPVFINGIAEYEHRIGNSHAFTNEEIKARVGQIRAAGFNAFRDAHQPHNLLYQHYWDSLGILWWPQLSAHIWFDSPAFRKNFKIALTEWIKERRNSPSVILWGLQNESKLPQDFARECVALIRELDPTASSQRLITTCNGGTGTDWDVPQNWTGTYGGDPATYAVDLCKQILVGEYGAWRTADLHSDPDSALASLSAHGAMPPPSLDRMDALMEMKIRLADSVKAQVAGHFAWLYASHDNPGRVQSGEGLRDIDRIGPVNYKGLLTSWEEPLDPYYLYRSNFISARTSPMVYIVEPASADITVYSNCEEVELFNDIDHHSLGRRKRGGIGTHFQWENVDLRYNVLYAIAYKTNRIVARDTIIVPNLPASPHFNKLIDKTTILDPAPGYHYIYRVNCGGPDYTDHAGNKWLADHPYNVGITPGNNHQDADHWDAAGKTWGSTSWTDDYPGLPAFYASQRYTTNPIAGTADWPLFQDFRYGQQKLGYTFPVPDGDYRVELYFVEPWLGAGGGMSCTGWRQFDIAINGRTVIKGLDIWKESGHDRALKKVVNVHITGGKLFIHFPHIAAGQAIISALAIASTKNIQPAPPSPPTVVPNTLEPAYDSRPVTTYKSPRIAGDTTEWTIDVGVGDTYSLQVKYRWLPTMSGTGKLEIRMADGTLIKEETVPLTTTLPTKWNYINTTTGTMINAGRYTIRLIVHGELHANELQVQ